MITRSFTNPVSTEKKELVLTQAGMLPQKLPRDGRGDHTAVLVQQQQVDQYSI